MNGSRERPVAEATDSQVVDIQAVRSRLVDWGLVYYALVAPSAVILSLSRSLEHGWHPIYSFHIFIACLIAVGAVLRKRLPYGVRAAWLLAFSLLIGLFGLVVFGLVGGGASILVLFPVLTAIAFGTRPGPSFCVPSLSRAWRWTAAP